MTRTTDTTFWRTNADGVVETVTVLDLPPQGAPAICGVEIRRRSNGMLTLPRRIVKIPTTDIPLPIFLRAAWMRFVEMKRNSQN
jgi:hypothetical protein